MFPDLPRLELDQLLSQLVQRAQEVMITQGRLRALLRANQMIIGHLTLPVVLHRIVEAARELVGARYAALGVIAPDGHLAEFIHVGMPEATVEQIGHLPQGKGLLGALIEDPRPIRLPSIGDSVQSAGFPPGHPPMRSFLGVPIRVRDEVFGNLYLAESTNGQFSTEDEELIKALVATAGVVIDNARLYETARTRQEWLQASAAITGRLLSADTGRPLELIAERSREIAQADLVTVVLPAEDGHELRVEIAVGTNAAGLPGLCIPLEGSLPGQVFTTGEPLRVSDPNGHPGIPSVTRGEPQLGPVMIVPLLGSHRVHGVLTAARRQTGTAFSAEDLDMAAGFANHASLAVELAEARAERQRAAMLDERERIAADLHDHVIQRLFAAGLSLQSIAAGLGPSRATERILGLIQDLDDTIGQIRTTIFQLHQVPQSTTPGVRARLLDVVTNVTVALGFAPAVRFAGLLEEAVPDAIAEDVVAVLREALSNVVRHARAGSVEVDITVNPDRLTLDVRDDGVGMAPTARLSGLANLRQRAERHHGSLTLVPRDTGGTWLSWSVPTR